MRYPNRFVDRRANSGRVSAYFARAQLHLASDGHDR
jgi:hypothetical protein